MKKRFEAHYLLVLLGSLAHNVVIWARRWLSSQKINAAASCGWCVMSFMSVAYSALMPVALWLRLY